ncbi:hypothetical protein [Chromohalobacter sp. 296-RDG]|uniref:hypothetical protein n=1 Tax=Chromohalobacter sp. 296-RDG TaxID=2994062 RepID=UPI0024691802|nr:hypothetical protein [Chromohalobacter sp. 296-RDG]
MITLATYGVGMLIGFWVAGLVTDHYATADGHDWQGIWLFPACFAIAVLLLFLVAFKDKKRAKGGTETEQT